MASESAMASIIAQLDRVMGALDKQVRQLNSPSSHAVQQTKLYTPKGFILCAPVKLILPEL